MCIWKRKNRTNCVCIVLSQRSENKNEQKQIKNIKRVLSILFNLLLHPTCEGEVAVHMPFFGLVFRSKFFFSG